MLQCVFENAENVVWSINGHALPESTVIRQIGTLYKIRIRNVTNDDFGVYTATATNSGGKTETKCELKNVYQEESEVKTSTDTGYGTKSTDEEVVIAFPPTVSALQDTRVENSIL